MLPVENTTSGLVQEVWDRLLGVSDPAPALTAVAEARVRIEFVTAGLAGSEGRVRRILAHPVAAAQCRRFLTERRWQVDPCHDTAGAARLVLEHRDPTTAALCPPGAAVAYGLEVFATGCGDSSRTWTRFLQLEPGEARPAPGHDRTLAVLSLLDRPGSLAAALGAVAGEGLNLRALHSRATPGSPGEYRFLLELEAGAADPRVAGVFVALRALGAQARLLGSFHAPAWPDEPARNA